MDVNQSLLEQYFRIACEGYFYDYFQRNKFLYFDLIPHSYFGNDYKIVPVNFSFAWKQKPILTFNRCLEENHNYGKPQCEFEQECEVSYSIKVNSYELTGKYTRNLKFWGRTFEPFGKSINVTMIVPEMVLLSDIKDMMNDIKHQFEIVSIEDTEFDGKIGFAFYTDVIRKARTTQPLK